MFPLDAGVTSLIVHAGFPAIFLGIFVSEITVALTAGMLAAKGVLSPVVSFLVVLASVMVEDALWFVCGYYLFRVSRRWGAFRIVYDALHTVLDQMIGRHSWVTLLWVKFFLVTKFLTILNFARGRVRVRVRHFLLINTPAALLWTAVIFMTGWSLSKGNTLFFPYMQWTINGASVIVLALLFSRTTLLLWQQRKNARDGKQEYPKFRISQNTPNP